MLAYVLLVLSFSVFGSDRQDGAPVTHSTASKRLHTFGCSLSDLHRVCMADSRGIVSASTPCPKISDTPTNKLV